MFKSFIVALVSSSCAHARGNNDGTSAENAKTITILRNPGAGVQTFVHHWNELAADGETW